MAFSLELDLSGHCIQTEIKRLHNRAVSRYFRSDPETRQSLEQIIEVTRHALESLDFQYLRSRHAPLAGQSDAHVLLTQEDDRIGIVLDGRNIFPDQ